MALWNMGAVRILLQPFIAALVRHTTALPMLRAAPIARRMRREVF
jgi:hypothetical protein